MIKLGDLILASYSTNIIVMDSTYESISFRPYSIKNLK